MKILNKAKLLVLIPLVTLTFGCETKESKTEQNKNPHTEENEVVLSPLRQQIQIMLAGKAHNEAVLKAEVGKQEWKATFAILKEELEKYTSQHGKRPEKKYIARTHALLSRLKAELNLEDAQKRNKQSLKDFEKTIQKAIEKEKAEKASH